VVLKYHYSYLRFVGIISPQHFERRAFMEHGYLGAATANLKAAAILSLVAFALCLPASSAFAGTITAYGGSSGPGLGIVTFGSLATPSPANDDVAGASPNTIIITEKRFDTFDGIWMIFAVADDGIGPTEYQLTETVVNNTGGNCIGYQVMLGSGTDSSWVHASLGTGLDFDAPDDNSPRTFSVYPTLVYDEVTIDAVGGVILAGETHVFTYAIDVPDGITKFTIRTSLREEPVGVESKTWGKIKALFR
jgi:hypothetical protein